MQPDYNKILVRAAQIVSIVFHPWYMPLFGIILVLSFPYFEHMPPSMSFMLVVTVFFFTILLPHIAVSIYLKVNGMTSHEMTQKERRVMPYILCIICYSALLYLLYYFHVTFYVTFVIVTALVIQLFCLLINHLYKISAHAAGSGALIGTLLGFSLLLDQYILGWICLSILMSGVVCTARMILRQHTLSELALGTLLGLICGWTTTVFMYHYMIINLQIL